ncbi:MAG: Crp/Fnr family transcriptional regulator [Coprobacillaceae bacterium]
MKLDTLLSLYPNTTDQEFIQLFFSKASTSILDSITVKTFLPKSTIISSSTSNDTIFILMKGKLTAREDHVSKLAFYFTEFHPIDIIGDYEFFAGVTNPFVSIISISEAECICIPIKEYEALLLENSEASFYRMKLLMHDMAVAASINRQYLFMDKIHRCMHQLVITYKKNIDKDKTQVLDIPREQLASRIGCSIRNCHRIIKQLVDSSYITIDKRKICITENQYQQMLDILHAYDIHI